MLVHFGVKPYLVFDGDYLPSKSGTERDRAAKRRESRNAGLELLRMGKTAAAQMELQKGVDVTPEMARQLIDELRKAKVDFVVAPYEADPQMVYLEKKGVVDGILSEDSDLLVFGAKCLITKLDQYGDCIAIRRDDFTSCREISLVGWSDAEFRWMAILSGCDYLPGVEKMGLKTAYRLIRKHKTVERLVKAVQFDGKMKVPAGYLENFKKAEEAFLYQWAFCPTARELVNLTEPENGIDVQSLPHVGKYVERDVARKVAQGYLHPHTKELLSAPVVPQKDTRTPLRRAMTQQTPDLKKHPSIESFFKARRTPLAELDPNTFTPSPSQQRLLEQQQEASWSAEPLGMRPPVVRALTDITRSQPPARRSISEGGPSMPSQSPKRQRLCSDSSLAFAMGSTANSMSSTSRFFSSKTFDSPSMRKSNRTKSGGQEKVNIWSDDSTEEAMSQMPDISTQPIPQSKSRKKLNVLKDECTEQDLGSQQAQDDSQPTTATTTTSVKISAANSQADTTTTSFDSHSQSQLFSQDIDANPFTEGLHRSLSDLRAKFTFDHSLASKPSNNPRPARQAEASHHIPEEAALEVAPQAEAETEVDVLVPCSSPLPAQYASTTADQDSIEAADTTNGENDTRDDQQDDDFTPDDFAAFATAPIKPLPAHLELASFFAPSATSGIVGGRHGIHRGKGISKGEGRSSGKGDSKGSEGFLVPDSEDEDGDSRGSRGVGLEDGGHEEAEGQGRRPSFGTSLGKFIFSA